MKQQLFVSCAAAGAITAIIPPLAVFMLLQEQFMRGFSLSSDK